MRPANKFLKAVDCAVRRNKSNNKNNYWNYRFSTERVPKTLAASGGH